MPDRHDHNPEEDTAIGRYLLGQAIDEERSAIQERLFRDEDFFDRVKVFEQDLIDAYVRGELSPADREQVKKTLLANPGARNDLAFSRALGAVASQATPSKRRTRLTPARWLLIAAVVVVAAGIGFLTLGPRAKNVPQDARVPQTQAPARQPVIYSTLLTPGVLRSGQKMKQVVAPPGTDIVQFQLDLESDRHASYSAVLRTSSGVPVWQEEALAPQPDQSLLCRVRASALKPASYEMALSAGGQVVAYYYFQIP